MVSARMRALPTATLLLAVVLLSRRVGAAGHVVVPGRAQIQAPKPSATLFAPVVLVPSALSPAGHVRRSPPVFENSASNPVATLPAARRVREQRLISVGNVQTASGVRRSARGAARGDSQPRSSLLARLFSPPVDTLLRGGVRSQRVESPLPRCCYRSSGSRTARDTPRTRRSPAPEVVGRSIAFDATYRRHVFVSRSRSSRQRGNARRDVAVYPVVLLFQGRVAHRDVVVDRSCSKNSVPPPSDALKFPDVDGFRRVGADRRIVQEPVMLTAPRRARRSPRTRCRCRPGSRPPSSPPPPAQRPHHRHHTHDHGPRTPPDPTRPRTPS